MNREHCISEIKKALQEIYTPTDRSMEELLSQIQIERVKSGELFQKEFTPALKIGFLIQGTLMVKRFEKDGTLNVVYFNTVERTPFVGVLESLIKNEVAPVEIKALENSWLGVLDYKKLLELYDNHHELEKLGRRILERHYLIALEQSRFRQNLNAKEKKKIAEQEYPRIFELCEKKDLANYIGVDPSTYSRLGKIKEKFKKIVKN